MSGFLSRNTIAGLSLAFGLCAATPASAYSDIYVFGDSLSDSGNIYAALGGTYPPAPYWNGRFSNGPTYADNLAARFGFGLAPSLMGGHNYAYGGATAAPGSTVGPLATDLGSQVASFRALAGAADSSALYVVWAGGNDLRAAALDPGNAATYIGNALAGVQSAISNLHAEGARRFLVMNMPNLGLTPESIGGGVVAGATFLSASYNAGFNAVINGLRAGLVNEDIRTLDTFSLLNTVVANPGDYGFSNVNSKCFDVTVPSLCAAPDSYLFWDGIHPTAAGHRMIADAAYNIAAVPEPETYAMMLAGLGLLGLAARRRKARAA